MCAFVNDSRWSWCAAVAIALILGCAKNGKTGPQLDLTGVSGNVTLDGKPLADTEVSYILQGTPPEGFHAAGARTDAQGHYELQTMGQKGTVAGSYKVTLSRLENASGVALKPEEGMDIEQLRSSGAVKQAVPPKYTNADTTDLTATVEKGKAEGYNFDLKSG